MSNEKISPHTAPQEKYRVIGVGTFDNSHWVEKDLDTLKEAKEYVDKETEGEEMLIMHVYDDVGRHRYQAGSY